MRAGDQVAASAGQLSLAIVGCGAVAANHYLPAIAASRQVRASMLIDADLSRARALAERWGVPQTGTDHREIPGRATAAVLALPNHLHAPVACELLRRGVHVLVEKPMATSTADCDAMVAATEEGNASLAVGLQFRFFDSSRWVKSVLDAGARAGGGGGGGVGGLIGRLRSFDLRLGVVSRWPFASDFFLRKETAGGGVLTDYGVHVLDLLLYWLGDWRGLSCRHDAEGGVESDCELELTMETGVEGFVEISRSRNLRNTCIFRGERGSLEVGIWDPDPPIRLRQAGPDPGGHEQGGEGLAVVGRARLGHGSTGLDFNGAFLRSLDDFAEAVRGGREPWMSGREGRRSVALIEACYAAAQPLVLPWMAPPPSARARP